MKLTVINTELFKLDGGAMFGVVPKVLWNKLNPADENNLCTWAMRCLLLQDGNRNILVDVGIGDKQDEKFFSHYYLHGEHTLMASLAAAGLQPSDITDVFLTHLHFDHVGGAVKRTESGVLEPVFTNARYWTNEAHYNWAYTPNAREKASFLKENFVPLREAGVLHFLPHRNGEQGTLQTDLFDVFYAYGHTDAMMLPKIRVGDKTVVYCADLLPSEHHIGAPYVMGYDMRPLLTMAEKETLLQEVVEQGHILFFEHAPITEAATLKRDEKGRIVVDKKGTLAEMLG